MKAGISTASDGSATHGEAVPVIRTWMKKAAADAAPIASAARSMIPAALAGIVAGILKADAGAAFAAAGLIVVNAFILHQVFVSKADKINGCRSVANKHLMLSRRRAQNVSDGMPFIWPDMSRA